jgi:cell division protein FtsB
MPPKQKKAARTAPSVAKRVAIVAAALGILYFAAQGGEFGTLDLLSQKRRMARLEQNVDSLQHIVDSLKTYRKRLETDPVLQEKVAREEFGMVRGNKELLYRFTEPAKPSAPKTPR